MFLAPGQRFLSVRTAAALILFLSILGCMARTAREPSRPAEIYIFRQTNIPSLTDDGEREVLLGAADRSLAYLAKKNSGGKFRGISPGHATGIFAEEKILRSLTLFKEIAASGCGPGEFESRVQENFTVWEIASDGYPKPVLLTGYYEPLLEGRLEPAGEFQYPIYRRPDDLIEEISGEPSKGGKKRVFRMERGQDCPYYSRREIDREGALQGKGLEIVWLRNSWDRFVLHIQGSGQVRLPDGKTLRVGFAGSNGRPYRSIGRYLIDQGFLAEKEISLGRVKDFLERNPALAEEIYCVNERYIFFRTLSEPDGPVGALGVPLTPGRSVATDPAIFPQGALGFLVSRQPVLDLSGKRVAWKPLRRFVFNQDTGAAIQGPSRVDLFLGSGEEAGEAAGQMKEEGRLYLLIAK
jgi:membrane-bound lytic murein transglycosylase A